MSTAGPLLMAAMFAAGAPADATERPAGVGDGRPDSAAEATARAPLDATSHDAPAAMPRDLAALALGAGAGGLMASSAALVVGSVLAEATPAARHLPGFVLAPAGAALGAALVAVGLDAPALDAPVLDAPVGDDGTVASAMRWGAGLGGLAGGGLAALSLGLMALDEPSGTASAPLLVTVGAPALAGAAGAAVGAALASRVGD